MFTVISETVAQVRIIRRKCSVKLMDKLSCAELGQQLGVEDVVKVDYDGILRWNGRFKKG